MMCDASAAELISFPWPLPVRHVWRQCGLDTTGRHGPSEWVGFTRWWSLLTRQM